MQSTTASPKKSRNIIILGIAGFFALCCICIGLRALSGGTQASAPTETRAPIEAVVTIAPTNTSAPTDTPEPTETPLPTPTSTPVPEPISLTGSGDSVLDFQKWDGPAIIKVVHNGGGNFVIWNDDANGEHMDLLVNTVGQYQGTLPLDFMEGEFTARFEVTAGGPWEIHVLPLDSVRREEIPGTFTGTGDDVIVLTGSALPDLLKADASTARGNFVIFTYGDNRDLVINEIAPSTGTVTVGRDTILLAITADGAWSIEVTAR